MAHRQKKRPPKLQLISTNTMEGVPISSFYAKSGPLLVTEAEVLTATVLLSYQTL